MTSPVDQPIRDAAATDLATSFFLEAGAGTGKTRILVERVVEIIAHGAAQVHDVVVITFTEKAAAELRSRVRERLHQRANAGGFEQRYRCRVALRSLANTHIETIHAFASALLREHPLESGIDPHFRQLDDVHAELDFQERWHAWIWNVSGRAVAAVERCLDLGMSLATMRDVARASERLRELAFSPVVSEPPSAQQFGQELGEIVAQAVAIGAACERADDTCLQAVLGLHTALAAAISGPSDALERGLRMITVRPKRGAKRNWRDDDARHKARELLSQAADSLDLFRQTTNSAALGMLAPVVAEFVHASAAGRKTEARLNFEDLLLEARDLVLRDAKVRRELQRRFKYILVDEFQDTDPLQAELVFLLAADDSAPGAAAPDATAAAPGTTSESARGWRSVRLAPGKLFLVGDPKQSIYRFRRADIDIYSAAKRVFLGQSPGTARVESIIQSFRAVPQVTEWINQIFKQVLVGTPQFPDAQPSYAAIQAHRSGLGGPGTVLLYPRAPLDDAPLGEVRAEEAAAIAAFILELAESDTWRIGEPAGAPADPERNIALTDICVLVDTRTAIDTYTSAFTAAGVAYVLDGGKEFFQRQEIRDLAAILRSIDDPSDQLSLVAALKSEAFACSDVDLLNHRLAGRQFNLFSSLGETDEATPVSSALARLRALHELKGHVGLPELVDGVIRDTLLIEPLLMSRDGARRAGNLKLIVERASEFAANDVDALRPFIRWLSQRQVESVAESEAQLAEHDANAIRIMTVHSAKGLEFPVVILAKLSGRTSGDRERHVVDRERGVLELEVGRADNRFRTPGFERAEQRERAYQSAEEARLLYVAATRARDLLVVPVYRSERFPGKYQHLPMLPSQLAATEPQRNDGVAGYATAASAPAASEPLPRIIIDDQLAAPPREAQSPAPPAAAAATTATDDHLADLVLRWGELREQRRAAIAGGPQFVTPSQLAADSIKLPRETEPADWDEDERDGDVRDEADQPLTPASGAPGFGGSALARRRGSLVHEVLARCSLASVEDGGRWVSRLCAAHGAPQLEPEVGAHVHAIMTSEPMQRVLAASNLLRELPIVYLKGESTYIEGYVDLAFEQPAGWVVVDYKTDRFSGSAGTLVQRYRPQVVAYADGLRAVGVIVVESALWFSATGELVRLQ